MFEIAKFYTLNDIIAYYKVPIVIIVLCITVSFVAALVDLGIAAYVTRILKIRISSTKLKRTLWKIIEYLAVLILASMVDFVAGLFTFYPTPIMTVIATIVVLGIEMLSVRETLSIARSAAATIPEIVARIVLAKNKIEAANILKDFNDLPKNKLNCMKEKTKNERYAGEVN